ncbi:C2H2-type zinc finger protein [Aeropyrum pernix]|nr:C2H2-type zinc finger protein [Aeropyrum pernix]
MPKCPFCGRNFKSSRGLLQHMRRSHDEYLTADPLESFARSLSKEIESLSKEMESIMGPGHRRRRGKKSGLFDLGL